MRAVIVRAWPAARQRRPRACAVSLGGDRPLGPRARQIAWARQARATRTQYSPGVSGTQEEWPVSSAANSGTATSR
ncbi:MAG TPA: hypothetical protein VGG75_40590 [Trebonia sp.]